MRAILYLHITGNKNRLRRAVRKLGTWIWLVLIILYACFVLPSLGSSIRTAGLGSPEYFVLFLSAVNLYLAPANYAAYARRKGLLFLPCDVQLMFPAPISPKMALVNATLRTHMTNVIVSLLLFLAGIFWFHVPAVSMLLYCLFNIFFSGLLEVCLVICLYGNERFSQKANRRFGRLMYLMIGCFLLLAVALIIRRGFSWAVIREFLSGTWVQMIPLLGWEIGVYRLIILGPDPVNITAALLYLAALGTLLALAVKLRCTGAYYEDAMKFADDYQEARARAEKGQVARVGQKQKLRRAKVTYRGGGARAVFYRQYLEARKNRWFIFGGQTLFAIFVAGFVTWLIYQEGNLVETLNSMGDLRYYVIPLGLLYFALVFSGQQNRWSRERDNPYIFLIPDLAFKKLWYATLMEHVVSAAHGLIIIAPLCWVLRLPWWMAALYLPLYVAMAAVRLYADVICETYLSNTIPSYGRTLLRMLLSFTAVFTALPAVLIANMALGPVAGLLAGLIFLCVMTVILMLAGAHSFSRMEING
ncbi:MAG TPA: putative ABC exporter domain-containing protein [Candidatus Egerieimonas intestinavium]|uniref:ABC exporter domain-containing protein n=1 Tax=Candidatus Egerieimonas intestinavium TaxID=2840777 RepID=A0A9D1EHE4_9FIRM|nr:putative ABC exporter domain-containing protein [Candidatus Egerieimonas intestinavium]